VLNQQIRLQIGNKAKRKDYLKFIINFFLKKNFFTPDKQLLKKNI